MRVLHRFQIHVFPAGSSVRIKDKCPADLRPYLGVVGRVLAVQGDYTTVAFPLPSGKKTVSVPTAHLREEA